MSCIQATQPMTDLPKTIWARVKPTVFYRGTSREVSELREWCEGYATPEIAETCNATQYIRTDMHDAALARIAELEAALEYIANHAGQTGFKQTATHENATLIFEYARTALKVTP
jgi:hypothetical protein